MAEHPPDELPVEMPPRELRDEEAANGDDALDVKAWRRANLALFWAFIANEEGGLR